ncbi:hypothetical protein J6590_003974 [Homalodisca vitripennis]|nr:hypothetical protein J6590_003974 [Homalodisca vitripennis]
MSPNTPFSQMNTGITAITVTDVADCFHLHQIKYYARSTYNAKVSVYDHYHYITTTTARYLPSLACQSGIDNAADSIPWRLHDLNSVHMSRSLGLLSCINKPHTTRRRPAALPVHAITQAVTERSYHALSLIPGPITCSLGDYSLYYPQLDMSMPAITISRERFAAPHCTTTDARDTLSTDGPTPPTRHRSIHERARRCGAVQCADRAALSAAIPDRRDNRHVSPDKDSPSS